MAGRIVEPLRERIRLSPSKYALAKKAGVSESILSRFVRQKQGLNLETVERLAEALDLHLSLRSSEMPLVLAPVARPKTGQRTKPTQTPPMDSFATNLRSHVEEGASTLLGELIEHVQLDYVAREHLRMEVMAEIHVSVGDMVSLVRRRLRRAGKSAGIATVLGPTVSREALRAACILLGVDVPARGKLVDERFKRHFRSLAQRHHPDKSEDASSADVFRSALDAFTLIGNYNDEVASKS